MGVEHVALAEVQCVRAVAVPVPVRARVLPSLCCEKIAGTNLAKLTNRFSILLLAEKVFQKKPVFFFGRSNDDYEGSWKTNQKKNGSTSSLPNLCFKLFFVFVMLSLFIFQ